MWTVLSSVFKKNQFNQSFGVAFGLTFGLLVCLVFLGGCQPRTHLSKHYAQSYRYIFNAQIQNNRTLVNPISANDAKAILEKRASRQSSSTGRQGRGRAFSRRSSNSVIEGLGL